jgi:hypothetical protein
MTDKFARKLPRLRPANHPDRLDRQLAEVRARDRAAIDHADRMALREFQNDFGLGIGI